MKTPTIPRGWRRLKPKEFIEDGDKYYDPKTGRMYFSTFAGSYPLTCFTYIRKIITKKRK